MLIGLALILFIPPIVSIVLGGAGIGKNEEEFGKYLDIGSDKEWVII